MVVWWIGGRECNDVIVNSGIDEYASIGPALVEAIDAQRLDVDGADFDFEMSAENIELDGAAPGVFGLDPSAVIVGLLVEDDGGILFRLRLDVLGDDGA